MKDLGGCLGSWFKIADHVDDSELMRWRTFTEIDWKTPWQIGILKS